MAWCNSIDDLACNTISFWNFDVWIYKLYISYEWFAEGTLLVLWKMYTCKRQEVGGKFMMG
jgi:hypothetical protein